MSENLFTDTLPEEIDPTKTYRPLSMDPRQYTDQSDVSGHRRIASRMHQGDHEVGDQRNKMFHYHRTIKNSQRAMPQ